MARIYPQWIPESERKENPERQAEYFVYDQLSKLGDNWLVLYGSAIKWAHRYGVSDREADFIIAHPDLGVLMLEVKGGSITRDGNVWYTTRLRELRKPADRRVRKPIKNPYTQATDAAKAYERKLDDYVRAQHLPTRTFDIATAVCFPDIEVPEGFYLGGDALPEITLDRGDVADIGPLRDRIYQVMKLYQGQKGDPPGKEGLELLKTVFAHGWHINSFMTYQLQTAEERRKELTEEQFNLLYSLQGNPKMLIPGCAGSGKTMIAAEKARRLAEEVQRVLLTCYNENLADNLREGDFVRPSMLVTNFHGLCYQLASSSKEVDLPSRWPGEPGTEEEKRFYNVTMPEALELAAVDLNMTFDAIIVDEGQDFKTSWLETLYRLLTDPEQGVFYIFYDDNQRIYHRESIPFNWPSYRLSKNMRNSNPIFEQVKCYYHRPEAIFPSGISGPEPWFVSLKDYADEYEAVQSVLEQLTEQGILLPQVAILTPRAQKNSIWGQKPDKPGKFAPVWQLKTVANQVACCTIYSFKGLERPVIILTELEHVYPKTAEELLYVAMSRARDYLIVIGRLPC